MILIKIINELSSINRNPRIKGETGNTNKTLSKPFLEIKGKQWFGFKRCVWCRLKNNFIEKSIHRRTSEPPRANKKIII